MSTNAEKFTSDMEKAGYDVDKEYGGRYSYIGPAVRVSEEELQDVIRATKVKLQWDSMGRGLVIYPCSPNKKYESDDDEDEDDEGE